MCLELTTWVGGGSWGCHRKIQFLKLIPHHEVAIVVTLTSMGY